MNLVPLNLACAYDLRPTRWVIHAINRKLQWLPDPLDDLYSPKIEAMHDRMVDMRKTLPIRDEPDRYKTAEKLVTYLVETRDSMRRVCAVLDLEYAEYNMPVRMDRDTVASRAHAILRLIENHLRDLARHHDPDGRGGVTITRCEL